MEAFNEKIKSSPDCNPNIIRAKNIIHDYFANDPMLFELFKNLNFQDDEEYKDDPN